LYGVPAWGGSDRAPSLARLFADGVEVLRRVRADPRTAGVPVVVFSAMPEADGRERAMGAGAADYWVKAGVEYKDQRRRVSAYLP
jgi:CheY-like chemotaxis protein